MVFARKILLDDGHAGPERSDILLISLHVIAVPMSIDDVTHRLVCDFLDFRDGLPRPARTKMRVHNHYIIIIDDERAVRRDSRLGDDGVDAVCDLRNIKVSGLRQCRCRKCQHSEQSQTDGTNVTAH